MEVVCRAGKTFVAFGALAQAGHGTRRAGRKLDKWLLVVNVARYSGTSGSRRWPLPERGLSRELKVLDLSTGHDLTLSTGLDAFEVSADGATVLEHDAGKWLQQPVAGGAARAFDLVGPLACINVTTITCAILIHLLGVKSFTEAIEFGLIVGVGFLMPMTVNIALNPLFSRAFLYSTINVPYFIRGIVLVSLILVAVK